MAESLQQLKTRYRWDPKSLRYRTPSGRFVSQRSLKQALNTFVRRAGKEIEALSRQVANGTLSVSEWQRAMVDRIKAIHLAQAAAAKGGWAQMTSRDFGKVGAGLKFHYKRLAQFAKDVASGKLAPGTITNRAGMYAAAGGGVYENTRRDAAADVFTEERNILGKSEHCQLCKDQTARGWVTVGDLIPIGERTCLTRCKCRYAFR